MFDSQNPINPPYKWWLNAWLTSPINPRPPRRRWALHWAPAHLGIPVTQVFVRIGGANHGNPWAFSTENDGFTSQNDAWPVRLAYRNPRFDPTYVGLLDLTHPQRHPNPARWWGSPASLASPRKGPPHVAISGKTGKLLDIKNQGKTYWCVLRRVAGWVGLPGVAGMMKLIVSQWIIP